MRKVWQRVDNMQQQSLFNWHLIILKEKNARTKIPKHVMWIEDQCVPNTVHYLRISINKTSIMLLKSRISERVEISHNGMNTHGGDLMEVNSILWWKDDHVSWKYKRMNGCPYNSCNKSTYNGHKYIPVWLLHCTGHKCRHRCCFILFLVI